MTFEESLQEMKNIQEKLHDYLEDNGNNTTLKDIFEDNRYHEDLNELIPLLHFVLKIFNNHYRDENFCSKIEEILLFFKEDMKTKLSNSELFHIFKSNKKILLFLQQEGILTFDEQIVKKIINDKYLEANYPKYFSPEIRPFVNKKWFTKDLKEKDWFPNELPADFYEKRKTGENDGYICELIRKDSIKDFVIFVTRNACSPNSIINPSIYETNNFLLKNKKITLIEYAAFFGSIQILNYLRLNKAELTPSLWHYAIHGKNAEIIQLIEENQIKPKDVSYNKCLIESIKCHHNDIANYILDQHLLKEKDNTNNVLSNSIKCYNLYFEPNNIINESSFFYLCKYDHYKLVKILLEENDIDINAKTICKVLFYLNEI